MEYLSYIVLGWLAYLAYWLWIEDKVKEFFGKKNKIKTSPTSEVNNSPPQTNKKTTTKKRQSDSYFFTCNGCSKEFDKDLELNKNTCQSCYIKNK